MICIKTEIPKEICEIDDELKAIYHSHDTVCIWVFKSREDRNLVNAISMVPDIDFYRYNINFSLNRVEF